MSSTDRTIRLPKRDKNIQQHDFPQKTPMTPQTSETSLVFPEVHGSARPPISSTKGDWRSVLIHPEAFERFKQIQKGQSGSPRFDLGDIVSAALDIVYAMPDAAALLQAQARTNFKQRL